MEALHELNASVAHYAANLARFDQLVVRLRREGDPLITLPPVSMCLAALAPLKPLHAMLSHQISTLVRAAEAEHGGDASSSVGVVSCALRVLRRFADVSASYGLYRGWAEGFVTACALLEHRGVHPRTDGSHFLIQHPVAGSSAAAAAAGAEAAAPGAAASLPGRTGGGTAGSTATPGGSRIASSTGSLLAGLDLPRQHLSAATSLVCAVLLAAGVPRDEVDAISAAARAQEEEWWAAMRTAATMSANDGQAGHGLVADQGVAASAQSWASDSGSDTDEDQDQAEAEDLDGEIESGGDGDGDGDGNGDASNEALAAWEVEARDRAIAAARAARDSAVLCRRARRVLRRCGRPLRVVALHRGARRHAWLRNVLLPPPKAVTGACRCGDASAYGYAYGLARMPDWLGPPPALWPLWCRRTGFSGEDNGGTDAEHAVLRSGTALVLEGRALGPHVQPDEADLLLRLNVHGSAGAAAAAAVANSLAGSSASTTAATADAERAAAWRGWMALAHQQQAQANDATVNSMSANGVGVGAVSPDLIESMVVASAKLKPRLRQLSLHLLPSVLLLCERDLGSAIVAGDTGTESRPEDEGVGEARAIAAGAVPNALLLDAVHRRAMSASAAASVSLLESAAASFKGRLGLVCAIPLHSAVLDELFMSAADAQTLVPLLGSKSDVQGTGAGGSVLAAQIDAQNHFQISFDQLVSTTSSDGEPGDVGTVRTSLTVFAENEHDKEAWVTKLRAAITAAQMREKERLMAQASIAGVPNLLPATVLRPPAARGGAPASRARVNTRVSMLAPPTAQAAAADDSTFLAGSDVRMRSNSGGRDSSASFQSRASSIGGVGGRLRALSGSDDQPMRASNLSIDNAAKRCACCNNAFSLTRRRHICCHCGATVCAKCSSARLLLLQVDRQQRSRACDDCAARYYKPSAGGRQALFEKLALKWVDCDIVREGWLRLKGISAALLKASVLETDDDDKSTSDTGAGLGLESAHEPLRWCKDADDAGGAPPTCRCWVVCRGAAIFVFRSPVHHQRSEGAKEAWKVAREEHRDIEEEVARLEEASARAPNDDSGASAGGESAEIRSELEEAKQAMAAAAVHMATLADISSSSELRPLTVISVHRCNIDVQHPELIQNKEGEMEQKEADKQDGAADDEGSVAGTAAAAQGSVAQDAASKITLLVYGDGQAVPHEFEVAGDSADFEADPNADLAGGAESAMTVATEWIESLQGAARYGMQRFRQARTSMTIGSTNIRERARTLELEARAASGTAATGDTVAAAGLQMMQIAEEEDDEDDVREMNMRAADSGMDEARAVEGSELPRVDDATNEQGWHGQDASRRADEETLAPFDVDSADESELNNLLRRLALGLRDDVKKLRQLENCLAAPLRTLLCGAGALSAAAIEGSEAAAATLRHAACVNSACAALHVQLNDADRQSLISPLNVAGLRSSEISTGSGRRLLKPPSSLRRLRSMGSGRSVVDEDDTGDASDTFATDVSRPNATREHGEHASTSLLRRHDACWLDSFQEGGVSLQDSEGTDSRQEHSEISRSSTGTARAVHAAALAAGVNEHTITSPLLPSLLGALASLGESIRVLLVLLDRVDADLAQAWVQMQEEQQGADTDKDATAISLRCAARMAGSLQKISRSRVREGAASLLPRAALSLARCCAPAADALLRMVASNSQLQATVSSSNDSDNNVPLPVCVRIAQIVSSLSSSSSSARDSVSELQEQLHTFWGPRLQRVADDAEAVVTVLRAEHLEASALASFASLSTALRAAVSRARAAAGRRRDAVKLRHVGQQLYVPWPVPHRVTAHTTQITSRSSDYDDASLETASTSASTAAIAANSTETARGPTLQLGVARSGVLGGGDRLHWIGQVSRTRGVGVHWVLNAGDDHAVANKRALNLMTVEVGLRVERNQSGLRAPGVGQPGSSTTPGSRGTVLAFKDRAGRLYVRRPGANVNKKARGRSSADRAAGGRRSAAHSRSHALVEDPVQVHTMGPRAAAVAYAAAADVITSPYGARTHRRIDASSLQRLQIAHVLVQWDAEGGRGMVCAYQLAPILKSNASAIDLAHARSTSIAGQGGMTAMATSPTASSRAARAMASTFAPPLCVSPDQTTLRVSSRPLLLAVTSDALLYARPARDTATAQSQESGHDDDAILRRSHSVRAVLPLAGAQVIMLNADGTTDTEADALPVPPQMDDLAQQPEQHEERDEQHEEWDEQHDEGRRASTVSSVADEDAITLEMDALEGALERKLSGIQISAEDADALRKVGAISHGDSSVESTAEDCDAGDTNGGIAPLHSLDDSSQTLDTAAKTASTLASLDFAAAGGGGLGARVRARSGSRARKVSSSRVKAVKTELRTREKEKGASLSSTGPPTLSRALTRASSEHITPASPPPPGRQLMRTSSTGSGQPLAARRSWSPRPKPSSTPQPKRSRTPRKGLWAKMMSTIRSNGASDQTSVVDGTGSAVAEELQRAGGAWAWAWSAGQNIYAPSSTVAAWARAWSEAQAIMSYTINGLSDALSASGIGTGANNGEAEDVGAASQGLQPGTASDSPFTRWLEHPSDSDSESGSDVDDDGVTGDTQAGPTRADSKQTQYLFKVKVFVFVDNNSLPTSGRASSGELALSKKEICVIFSADSEEQRASAVQAIRLRAAATASRVLEADDQVHNRVTRTGSSSAMAFGHHPHSELALTTPWASGLGSLDDSDTESDTDDDDINNGQVVHTSIASLATLTQRMKGAGLCADRTHRMTVYKDCFVGREAVDWLVRHEAVSSSSDSRTSAREAALALGRRLLAAGFIKHVTEARKHTFQDKFVFYRFADEQLHASMGSHRSASSSSAADVPLAAGWLQIKGGGGSRLRRRAWARRWVEAYYDRIEHYRSPPAHDAGPREQRDCRVHRLLPTSKVFFAKEKVQKHAFAFKVVQEQSDTEVEQEVELLLNGSTQDDVLYWMDILSSRTCIRSGSTRVS